MDEIINETEISNAVAAQSHFSDHINDCLSDNLEEAIRIRKASKSYGKRNKRTNAIQCLDMTINKGSVYALLGASGCGKTTILSCILGLRTLDSGKILIFGKQQGTQKSSIQGRKVGYMPQDLLLYEEFTMKETIEYFGRIYDLPDEFVKTQIEYLLKLLDLIPVGNQKIKMLSGGQKRRVSFAVAVFQEPDFLILDEPTTGVDPVLRSSIWNHLHRLRKDLGTTVVISTHYIEEARKAHQIGLMNSGYLMVEDSPNRLLSLHSMTSLEDVFYNLCSTADQKKRIMIPNKEGTRHSVDLVCKTKKSPRLEEICDQNLETSETGRNKSTSIKKKCQMTLQHLKAMVKQNLSAYFFNVPFLALLFDIPSIAMILFCLAIGRDPKSLKMAIVNEELNFTLQNKCSDYTKMKYSFELLSCRYLQHLNNTTTMQIEFGDFSDAEHAFKNGQVWGIIHFEKEFSKKLIQRIIFYKNADIETVLSSQIKIILDWSNCIISNLLQFKLQEAFFAFAIEMQKERPYIEQEFPIKFLEPIFGSKANDFSHYMAPGTLLSVIYMTCILGSAMATIIDRSHGLYERNLVAGVKPLEIIISHFVCQFIALVGLTCVLFIVILYIFKVQCLGSLPLAVLISLFQGMSGIFEGLVISSLVDCLTSAGVLCLGTSFTNLMMSGVLWPQEGMSVLLRMVCGFLPHACASNALRNVFTRGWGIRPQIYMGLVINGCWILFCIILVAIILRFRKEKG